jgi:hypothetical protein
MIPFIVRLINITVVIGILFGVFGWFWLPQMLNGNLPGPYWLILFYSVSIPIVILISLAFLFVLMLYRFVLSLIVRAGKADPTSLMLRNGMLKLLVVTLVAGFPGYIGEFSDIGTQPFGGRTYQLLMQQTSSYASYSVFNCLWLMSWCESELQTARQPRPLPTATPMSDRLVVIDNTAIQIPAPLFATPSPPAALLVNSSGLGLYLQVGNEFSLISTIVPTATPFPTFTPISTPPPEIIVTIAPSATP